MAAQPPFALHPADAIPGVIDLTMREGIKLYQNATRSFYSDPSDYFNCEAPGLHGFLKEVEGRASRFGWRDAILEIPNDINNPLGGTKKPTHALRRTILRSSTHVGKYIHTWDILGRPRHRTLTPMLDEFLHPSWQRQSEVMVRPIHPQR